MSTQFLWQEERSTVVRVSSIEPLGRIGPGFIKSYILHLDEFQKDQQTWELFAAIIFPEEAWTMPRLLLVTHIKLCHQKTKYPTQYCRLLLS